MLGLQTASVELLQMQELWGEQEAEMIRRGGTENGGGS